MRKNVYTYINNMKISLHTFLFHSPQLIIKFALFSFNLCEKSKYTWSAYVHRAVSDDTYRCRSPCLLFSLAILWIFYIRRYSSTFSFLYGSHHDDSIIRFHAWAQAPRLPFSYGSHHTCLNEAVESSPSAPPDWAV